MIYLLMSAVIMTLAVIVGVFHNKIGILREIIRDTKKTLTETTLALAEEQEKNRMVLSQKKSSEVNLGAIAENSLAFLKELPYKSQDLRHLGSPIDYIYFDYYGSEGPCITLIEVKSGNSKESYRQKIIKNAIRQGKVFYEQVRIDNKGVKIKRAKNAQ